MPNKTRKKHGMALNLFQKQAFKKAIKLTHIELENHFMVMYSFDNHVLHWLSWVVKFTSSGFKIITQIHY